MRRHLRFAILLVSLVLLIACAQPLPPERAAYAGEWRGKGVTLRISPDGHIAYRREEGANKVSIEGPIKRFDGDDFEVGIGVLVTRFWVSRPPEEVDGEWTMEVDGRTLRRLDGPDIEAQPAGTVSA